MAGKTNRIFTGFVLGITVACAVVEAGVLELGTLVAEFTAHLRGCPALRAEPIDIGYWAGCIPLIGTSCLIGGLATDARDRTSTIWGPFVPGQENTGVGAETI